MKHVRVIIAILLILLAWFGSGCINAKKASNYMRNHPDVAAPVCADLFPVKTVTDTKAFDSSIAVIDSLIAAIDERRGLTDAERAELYGLIDRLQNDRPDCDSVMLPALDLIAKERQRADQLASDNKRLQQAARNVKPIRDTVENTAKTRAYQLQLQQCEDEKLRLTQDLGNMTESRDEWRSNARGWKWKFWILLIIAAILIFRKQIFSLITKIPFMKSILIFLMASVMLASCSNKPDDVIHKETSEQVGWKLNEAGTANEPVIEKFYTISPTWGQSFGYAYQGGYALWLLFGVVMLAGAVWVFYCEAKDLPIVANWDPKFKVLIGVVLVLISIASLFGQPAFVKWNNDKPIPASQYYEAMARDGNTQAIWDSLADNHLILGGDPK